MKAPPVGGAAQRRQARTDTPSNSRCRPPRPVACPEAAADDAAWFQRHIGRNHRLRFPIGGEAPLVRSGLPDGIVGLMAVRQVREGVRVRLPVGGHNLTDAMINSEAIARSAYEFAAARVPKLAAFERAVLESAP